MLSFTVSQIRAISHECVNIIFKGSGGSVFQFKLYYEGSLQTSF